MRRERTESEYRRLIGMAVFWLVRWPGGPASQPRLEADLVRLTEIVDEDAHDALERLVAAIHKEQGEAT